MPVSENPPTEESGTAVALRSAVREIEAHVAGEGWDSPPRLYALADTAELLAAAPALAEQMGLDPEAGGLTSVEQELDPAGDFEQLLVQLDWPPTVVGAVAVVERLVMARPDAGEQLDAETAAADPDAQEVRLVVGVLRPAPDDDVQSWCALRLRAHDEAAQVIEGADVVPGLVRLLGETFADAPA
ncbi:hypothetical protein KLP28_12750 [Nocardioidaceae bacterium]|nr:hypothetical protein KLP28_12750 [Nocardioidaceae bacterium]